MNNRRIITLLFSLVCYSILAQPTKKDIMDSLRSEGQAMVRQGLLDKGIELYFQAIKMAEEEGYLYKVATLQSLIGDAHRQNKNWETALEFNERAHETILSVQDGSKKIKYITGGIKNNLALAYHRAEKYQEALRIYFSQFGGFVHDAYDSSKTYNNIARTYVQIRQFDSALYFLDKAEPLRIKVDNPNHSAYAFKEYATIYNETGQYEKSVYYGEKVLEIGKQLESDFHLEDAYRNLRNAYFNWGHFKESANYGSLYTSLIQKIRDLERDEIIAEMQTKYDVAQKDHEIESLQYETIIAEKTTNLLIITILGVVLITVLIILYQRKAIKSQRTQKELSETQLHLKKQELIQKEEELKHFVNVIKEKNKLIESLDDEANLKHSKKEDMLPKLYESVLLTEDDWEEFKHMFEDVYENFFGKLKSTIPTITNAEMRLSALMKLKLTTKEISGTLGISPASVTKTKYRIKKKLEMDDAKELEDFVMAIG